MAAILEEKNTENCTRLRKKKNNNKKRENFVEWTEWTDISSQIKVWENQKNYIAQLKKMNTKQLFINKTKN